MGLAARSGFSHGEDVNEAWFALAPMGGMVSTNKGTDRGHTPRSPRKETTHLK